MLDNYPDTFAFVQVHHGDDHATAWGDARWAFYNAGSYPTSWFAGVWARVGAQEYDTYEFDFLSLRAIPTDVSMDLFGVPLSGQTYRVQATVCIEPEPEGTAKTMRVYMVQVLDNWPLPSDTPPGVSYSRNGFKQAADTHGSEPDITLNPGECQSIQRDFTFDARSMASQDDIKIIAWAQDPQSSGPAEVYQAAIMPWPFASLPGDFDLDLDVDLGDHANFIDCMAGPDSTPDPTAPTTAQDCLDAFDFHSDDDVDLADFAAFQVAFTG